MTRFERRFRVLRLLPAGLLAWWMAGLSAYAYNRPVDEVGPLTVRIDGPEEVTEVGVSLPVGVVIENKGDSPIQGTVELGVIDHWSVTPNVPVAFEVGAKATARLEFEAVAGPGTFSAHYPIHAYARFTSDGERRTAHPVLILETELTRPPRATAPIAWRPFSAAANSELALWRLPVHRSVVAVFGEEPKTMPVGWQGSEDASHGAFSIGTARLGDDSRSVLGIHPPWFDGRVGTQLVEFPLTLPAGGPLRLRFANGMTPTGQSDGVTFRVRVLPLDAPAGEFGPIVFERHSAAKTWDAAEVDLSEFAGRSVRVQLESHPGPENNTGWDQSYWAEPVLVAGRLPEPALFPPAGEAGSRRLGSIRGGGGPDPFEVRLWPGKRGLLDAVVGFSAGERSLFFQGFETRVLGGRIDDTRSPLLLTGIEEEPLDNGYGVRHTFQSTRGTFDLVGRLTIDSGTLRADFHLENEPEAKPWSVVVLEDVAVGPWSETVKQVYAGHGNVVRDPETFRLGFDGHRLATSFVGFDFPCGISMVQGSVMPPVSLEVQPDRRHYSLHAAHFAKFTFIPAENAFAGAKAWREVNGLEAAGGVKKLAGRFVFDLWGGRYGESAEALRRAFGYGLTDSLVIWHNWQRWGYDYRLPEIYPPNPKLGTPDELRDLIGACEEAGALVALHDNYIDFYPDAEGFSYTDTVAFHQNGTPVKAWLNEGRGARSYRYRADRVEPFLRENLRTIKKHLTPTAYFIDVWASASPYDYWTADGRFFDRIGTRNSWGEHFAWIRDFFGNDAPQVSESGHDQLIGWLDGAQTNHLRVGPPVGKGYYRWAVLDWKCSDAERTPWFDVAHHDRFILHGSGYDPRYRAGLDARLHGMYSDDYVSTEVLTGHPAMVSRPFGRNVVRKYWLLGELMRGLALRRIERVEYAGGDLHRQHVRWSGGADVWVNRGPTDWEVGGVLLPQYGFLARVPTEAGPIEASIARRGELISELVQSPQHLYVNGRQLVDPRVPIRLAVDRFEYLGDRRLAFELAWQAEVPVPVGWAPFLHFCEPDGEIAFQASHRPGTFAEPAKGRIVASAESIVPEGLLAGQTYDLCYGVYDRATGTRLKLAGPDVGDGRIRLGTIRLEGEGDKLEGVAWVPHQPEADPYLARQNPDNVPIDFGPVATAGGCRLAREGDTLVVTPLPSEGAPIFTVDLEWPKLPWELPVPTHAEAVAEDGALLGREPVGRKGLTVSLPCRPGVFAYRLVRE